MILCLEYIHPIDLLCVLNQMGRFFKKKKKPLMLLIKGIFSIKNISTLHMNLKRKLTLKSTLRRFSIQTELCAVNSSR